MATNPIQQYYRDLEKVKRAGHTLNESSLRAPFQHLLLEYCRTKDLTLVVEASLDTFAGKKRPDGTVKDQSGLLDWGYWESKDPKDSLDAEIQKKFAIGYPRFNIIFEDSREIVLIQDENRYKAQILDANELDKILKAFINYERPEIQEFRKALEVFRTEVPELTQRLRELLFLQQAGNPNFVKARDRFLEICRDAINPAVTPEDISEMLVQHILTEDLFVSIFDNPDFHKENAIARELENVLATFFHGKEKKDFLKSIRYYYKTIQHAVSGIEILSEKQRILKVVYEEFYKAYNPKGADKLGIVYTPNEIVRFMIHSVNQLLEKHFNKTLSDEGVNILDPATGTGTYICDLIEYITPAKNRKQKYQNEIFCNEVSILPYYIANLNIEFTYNALMGEYEPFENLCFVDTLDNIDGLVTHKGQTKAGGLFGSLTAENAERIKRQNEQKISVIIGNPPYNAMQSNFNDNNPNRPYFEVDKRIKETFVKQGSATNKNQLYDMYVRFYRWAMDRLTDKGIIAFVTNRSFIDSRTFDGFRKGIETDFSECYIVDTRSDVRANPKIAGTTHNVFGIQTGVAVMFLVRKPKPTENAHPCKIFYITLQDEQKKEEKLSWFAQQNDFDKIDFTRIQPDEKHNWINQTDNDFDSLLPLMSKDAKAGGNENAVFQLFSRGLETGRDEWVYDFTPETLTKKMEFFIEVYKSESNKVVKAKSAAELDHQIKWDRELTNYLNRGIIIEFNSAEIVTSLYRPFSKQNLYYHRRIIRMPGQWISIIPLPPAIGENLIINFSTYGSTKPFFLLGSKYLVDLHFTGDSQCLPLYRYTPTGERIDNITDWALNQFRERYETVGAGFKPAPTIEKTDIFHYVYAVLHNPAYRKKYELNLKRDFPRIPFYDDFFRWAAWGKALMGLHVEFETVAPYPLERRERATKPEPTDAPALFESDAPAKPTKPKIVKPITAKLSTDKDAGLIVIDDQTTLAGVPPEAWNYKLGNRSALEWILDQYKESKIKDPTIAQKTLEGEFKAYRFADYKETVIDLLCRVCTVSVETVRIVGEMEKENQPS